MKPLKLALVVALLPMSGAMVGCSSNSDSGDDPDLFPQNLTSFTLDDYRDISDMTDKTSIVGTWVGVSDIQYTYLEQEGSESVDDPRTFESRREFMVIRRDSTGDLEISSCSSGGGFRSVTSVSSDRVSTFRGNFTRTSNNSLFIPSSSATFEDPATSIIVTAEVSSEFIKVLNTTGPLGSMNWNWEETDGQIYEDIYCAGLNNLEGGGQKFSAGMIEGSSLQFSLQSFVAQTDLVFDDGQTLKRHVAEDIPEDFIFEISDSDSFGLSFIFTIQRSDDKIETVTGSGNFSVTLP